MIAMKQFLRKQRKLFEGLMNRSINLERVRMKEWWNKYGYEKGVSDRQTISKDKDELVARYHYCSVEMIILKHFYNKKIRFQDMNVIDIGAGAGHWMDFYRSLGAGMTIGIDISEKSANYLTEKYRGNIGAVIHQGRACECLPYYNDFRVVNAIGVMFHIVDDEEWRETIKKAYAVLVPNGLFIVSGHFGLVDGLNTQVEKGQVTKRLRSKGRWAEALREEGFKDFCVYRNRAYLGIDDNIPENNVLIATK